LEREEKDMTNREKRQYFEDLYVTIFGSNLKNGHGGNPSDILKLAEVHWKALTEKFEALEIYKDETI
jgi:hypothetical protein